MKPWHDCPTCPECGIGAGMPIREAFNGFAGDPGSRLFCPACGAGWVGNDAELAQAEKAQAAWDAECERERKANTTPVAKESR